MTTNPRQGLILLAHGARDAAWARPFEDVAQRVRDSAPGLLVRNAYLEFMAPNLVDAGQALAEAGCTHVEVLPVFLGAGGHVRKDVPLQLSTLMDRHPQIGWALRPAVGESPLLVAALARIALEPAP
jgi:sirohydrochlorin cobaltochelatase